MRIIKKITLVVAVLFAFVACKNETAEPTYAKVEFGIDGMTCAMGCAKAIEKKMANLEGVKSAKVDFDKRLAMVEYDESKVNHKSLEDVVAKVGDVYKVKDMKNVDDFKTEKSKCESDCSMECCTGDAKKDKAECAKGKMPSCKKKEVK